MTSMTELLTVPRGPVDLASYDTHGKPGFDGKKKEGKAALYAIGDELSDLQERLFAEGRVGGKRRILLVLPGMDTSGKGGILRHVVGLVDPQGVHIKAFKAPTKVEQRHDFLWRIQKELPGPGILGVFDRSHYEDVLIAKVRSLAPPDEIERRYRAINDFEKRLVDGGTTVVKCMLHISAEEQKSRLLARLDDPSKRWKFNPGDIDQREFWPDYQRAYETALERTGTEHAPWLLVPGDRKWYGKLAVGQVLLETLRRLDPQWPAPDYDPEEQRRRLVEEKLDLVIRTVSATRYVAPLREGGSLPGIVEADDLGTYVCKFRGAGQGLKVLVAEVVVGELARALGIRTPELVAMSLERAIGKYEADQEVQDLLTASIGLNLGVDFLPGSFGYDAGYSPDPGVAASILWLDALTANVDRSWRNPNLLVWHKDLWAIDHGACLYFHHGWSGGIGSAERFAHQPYDAADHVLVAHRAGVPSADATLAPQVNRDLLGDVLALVPDEWFEPVPGASSPADLRAAYVDFLLARVSGERAWLPVSGAA